MISTRSSSIGAVALPPEIYESSVYPLLSVEDLILLTRVNRTFRNEITKWIEGLFPFGANRVIKQLELLLTQKERVYYRSIHESPQTPKKTLEVKWRVYALFLRISGQTDRMCELFEQELAQREEPPEGRVEDAIYKQKRLQSEEQYYLQDESIEIVPREGASVLEEAARKHVACKVQNMSEALLFAHGMNAQESRDQLRIKCLEAIEQGSNEEGINQEERAEGIVRLRMYLQVLNSLSNKGEVRVDFESAPTIHNHIITDLLFHAIAINNKEAVGVLLDFFPIHRLQKFFFTFLMIRSSLEIREDYFAWFHTYFMERCPPEGLYNHRTFLSYAAALDYPNVVVHLFNSNNYSYYDLRNVYGQIGHIYGELLARGMPHHRIDLYRRSTSMLRFNLWGQEFARNAYMPNDYRLRIMVTVIWISVSILFIWAGFLIHKKYSSNWSKKTLFLYNAIFTAFAVTLPLTTRIVDACAAKYFMSAEWPPA